jgi:hypothetical protein
MNTERDIFQCGLQFIMIWCKLFQTQMKSSCLCANLVSFEYVQLVMDINVIVCYLS